MKLILPLLTLAAAAMPAAAQTQSLVDAHRDEVAANAMYYEIGGTKYTPEQADSINRIISQYYYDQFRGFQDPEAPYFMFMSRDAQLAMGIGGCVRMRGWYDIGNVIQSNGFAPYLIPMTPGRIDDKRIGTSPAGTAIFFRVLGRNKMLGHYQLYIEGNFNGYDHVGFQLKKAYAQVRDFTIGYASCTFGDPAAQAPVIDAQGANNKIGNTAVLVRYMHTMRERWTFAVSAEMPSPQIGADGTNTGNINNAWPDGSAFIQYAWGPTAHIRLSGTVRSLGYRDLLTATNHRRAGWGVLLSGVGHPAAPLTVYGTLNYGRIARLSRGRAVQFPSQPVCERIVQPVAPLCLSSRGRLGVQVRPVGGRQSVLERDAPHPDGRRIRLGSALQLRRLRPLLPPHRRPLPVLLLIGFCI